MGDMEKNIPEEEKEVSADDMQDQLSEETDIPEEEDIFEDTDDEFYEEETPDVLSELPQKEEIGGKKMLRNILIATAVVLLLIGGAVTALLLQTPEEEVYPSKVLVDTDAVNIEKIDVINSMDESFTITPIVVADELQWSISDIDFDDVQQYSTNLFAVRCYYLEAQMVIGTLDGVDLAEYGLKDPAVTVTVKYVGKTATRTFYLGDEYAGGGYYLYEKGVNELYIVADFVGQYWSVSLNEMRSLPGLTVPSSDLATISLEVKNQPKILMSYIPGILAGTESWQILEPVYVRTNEDKVTTYLETVTEFQCTGYVADRVGDDAEKYGFDDPEAKAILMNYSGEVAQFLLLGDIVPDTSGTRYCVILDTDGALEDATVYSVELAAQGLFNLQLLDIIDPFVLSTNIDWVQDGTFTLNGEEYNITIERTPQLDDDGNQTYDGSGYPQYDSKFYLNGILMNEDQFRTFYGKIVMLQIDGQMSSDDVAKEEVFSYDFNVKVPILPDDEDGEITYREVEYSAEMYAIDVNFLALRTNENEETFFKVKASSIDALSEALELLLQGKLPTD